MTRLSAIVLLGIFTLAGCSAASWPAASPAFTPQADCEHHGGWWHADMGFCEYQSPGSPQR